MIIIPIRMCTHISTRACVRTCLRKFKHVRALYHPGSFRLLHRYQSNFFTMSGNVKVRCQYTLNASCQFSVNVKATV